MQLLLSGIARNYLPSDWPQLSASVQGISGGFQRPRAGRQRRDFSQRRAFGAATRGPAARSAGADLSARRSAALLQGITQEALANSSGRFASIQQLIAAIAATNDQKASWICKPGSAPNRACCRTSRPSFRCCTRLAQAQAAARCPARTRAGYRRAGQFLVPFRTLALASALMGATMGFFQTFWSWLSAQLAGYIGDNTALVAAALEPAVVTLAALYVMVLGLPAFDRTHRGAVRDWPEAHRAADGGPWLWH